LATTAELEFQDSLVATDEPEFDLLCQCCAQQPLQLRKRLQSALDWDRVLKLATHHRVLPALYFCLENQNDVPASIQSAINARFAEHARRVLRFSAELKAILRHFHRCGVQVVCHKGPVLSQSLYGDPAMRQFGDLDFLVRSTDIPRARAALHGLGYEPQVQLSRRQEREYLRSGYEYVFGSGLQKNLVELQWQVLPHFYSISFDMEELFGNTVDFEFEGCSTRVLRNEDLLLVLCAHAAKHEWVHLGMLRDIATLSHFELDWKAIETAARQIGIFRIVMVSVLLARDLLGGNLPGSLNSSTELPAAEVFANKIRGALVRAEESHPESLRYFQFMVQLRERPQDRRRFLWRLASTPSVGEWNSVDLPDALFPLYRAVRAARLARKAWPF